MLRIIPVIDIRGGQAVHAVAGVRDNYRPLRSNLRPGSDPILIAQAVRDRFGFHDLYLADLDAIHGLPPSLSLYKKLSDLRLNLWVDAGLLDNSYVSEILNTGVSQVVVGLETVAGPEGLKRILERAGPTKVAFSLDLRNGRATIAESAKWNDEDPAEIARSVVAMGIATVIILDLAQVGLGQGIGTLPLLENLSNSFPNIEWIAGGGVACQNDLAAIKNAGGSAALVGSALHDGRCTEAWIR